MPRAKAASSDTTGPKEVPSDYFDDAWIEIYPQHGDAQATARALLDAAGRVGYREPERAVHAISGGYRTLPDVLTATDLTDAAT